MGGDNKPPMIIAGILGIKIGTSGPVTVCASRTSLWAQEEAFQSRGGAGENNQFSDDITPQNKVDELSLLFRGRFTADTMAMLKDFATNKLPDIVFRDFIKRQLESYEGGDNLNENENENENDGKKYPTNGQKKCAAHAGYYHCRYKEGLHPPERYEQKNMEHLYKTGFSNIIAGDFQVSERSMGTLGVEFVYCVDNYVDGKGVVSRFDCKKRDKCDGKTTEASEDGKGVGGAKWSGCFRVTDPDTFMKKIKAAYEGEKRNKGNNWTSSLHDRTAKLIRQYVKDRTLSSWDGTPGLHAEVQALNDYYHAMDLEDAFLPSITDKEQPSADKDRFSKINKKKVSRAYIFTARLAPQKKGKVEDFMACANCSGIIPHDKDNIVIPTGRID